MAVSIGETIKELHRSLKDYIEAAYHISNSALVTQRRNLLEQIGVIHQQPYLESTPRYQIGTAFASIKGLDPAVVDIIATVSTASEGLELVIHDPPFRHQAEALQYILTERKSLVVMTGTGSGKTESFLLPILGKIAAEARNRPRKFNSFAAMRALILYPMNALVNDQLGRLRLLLGDRRLVRKFKEYPLRQRPARAEGVFVDPGHSR